MSDEKPLVVPVSHCTTSVPNSAQLRNVTRALKKSPAGPYGFRAFSLEGKLPRLGAVRQHGPDLRCSRAARLENDVAIVGGPTGMFVAPKVLGHLYILLRSHVH